MKAQANAIRSLAAALLIGGLMAACTLTAPNSDPAAAVSCRVASSAREIPAVVRQALAAAQHGDQGTMLVAARKANELGTEIVDAMATLGPSTSTKPAMVQLLTVGLFAQQAAMFFGEEIPDAESLASVTQSLPALDQALANADARLFNC